MHPRNAAVSIVLGALALSPSDASAKVLINEFNTGTPDYLELRNTGYVPVDLSGWKVQSWTATGPGALVAETPFVFPAGTKLKGSSFLVLQENGAAGQPGTLPGSMSTGAHYLWTPTKTIEIALYDAQGRGVDYVYLNQKGNALAPHLPPGLNWAGEVQVGTSGEVRRHGDYDSDDGWDWVRSTGSGSPGALNPGQVKCDFFKDYGEGCPGSGGFVPTLQSMTCPGAGDAVYLRIDDAVGHGWAIMLFARTGGASPLPNGCLVRLGEFYPLVLELPLGGAGPGRGELLLGGHLPLASAGSGFTVQAVVLDPGAEGGLAVTNAARVAVK